MRISVCSSDVCSSDLELDHELLGRHVDDLRARTPSPEFVADGVQQVRLAAPGTAGEEEWVERDILGRGQGARAVERDFVGLADDESLEPIARPKRGGIELFRTFGRCPPRLGPPRHDSPQGPATRLTPQTD